MPLYEMHSMAKEKRDSVRDNCSNDLPFIPENDIVELVWENGQIIMQSQSCRGRQSERYSNSATLPPHETKARVKDIGNVSNLRNIKFGNVDSVFGESPFSVPNGELGLNEAENDDVFPWLNYPPIERSLQHVYGSDILPEISGVTVNETFSQNMDPSIANKCSSNPGHMDFHFGSFHDHVHTEEGHVSKVSITASKGPATSNVKSVQFYPFSSQQCQKSLPISASVVTDIVNNSTSNTSHLSVSMESTEIPTPVNVPIAMKMQKQGPASLRENNSSLINFSHFAQTAALFSANFQNSCAEAHSGASAHDEIGNKDKAAVAINSSPTESTLVHSTSGSKKDANSHGEPTLKPSIVDSKPSKPSNLDAKPPQTSSEGDVIMRNNGSNESPVESSNKGQVNGEKPEELVRASSSICSGNIAERVTDGPKANMKRNCHDSEDSECCSEDVEAESERVKRMAPRCSNGDVAMDPKEAEQRKCITCLRGRRDKINEKMRALQELIPNCNKVDKASMLDEAIEYLKTLQLQVQIMSMGTGLYIPSMMLPTGMQHINPAHLAHFMPMGVGMGVGYGMNMLDMSGRSSGCPVVQFPAMQGAHFTSSTIPGPQSLHGMPGSNLQMFGHPGQGFPMPMPQAHSIPVSGGCHDNSFSGLNGRGMAGQLGNFGANFNPSSRDPVQNTNSRVTRNTVARRSEAQTSNQCEMPNEDVAQTTLMQNDSQALDAKQSGAIPSVNSNGKVT